MANCPIMDLCLLAERKSGLQLSRLWWEHTALDILGLRAGLEEAELVGGGGERGIGGRVIRRVG